ncbi:hypothetical protein [Terriglobus sp. RCC_193]|uniref:hypothetical protein n=1 Tax=Terriglobus sp. RCC_193 TaxID=3239218 RepID=UPI003524C6A8
MNCGACYQVPERLFPLLCGVEAPAGALAANLPDFAADGLYSMQFEIGNHMFGHHMAVAITGGEATIYQAWVGEDGYTLTDWLNPAGNHVYAGVAPAHFVDAHRRYSPVGGDYVNNPAVQFGNFRQGLANVRAAWRMGNHDAADDAWGHVSGVLSGETLRMACWLGLELRMRYHAFSVGTTIHVAGPVVAVIAPPPGPPPPVLLPPPGPPPLHLAPPLPLLGPPPVVLGPPVPQLPGGNMAPPDPKGCCVIL